MNPDVIHSTIFPTLHYADANAAIEFLCSAFGFTKRLVVPNTSGGVMHSELSYGDGVIMVSTIRAGSGHASQSELAGNSHGLCLRVEDPDSHYRNAIAHGAEIVQELKDEDYGSRGYMARDTEGHVWYFGTYRPRAHWE